MEGLFGVAQLFNSGHQAILYYFIQNGAGLHLATVVTTHPEHLQNLVFVCLVPPFLPTPFSNKLEGPLRRRDNVHVHALHRQDRLPPLLPPVRHKDIPQTRLPHPLHQCAVHAHHNAYLRPSMLAPGCVFPPHETPWCEVFREKHAGFCASFICRSFLFLFPLSLFCISHIRL